MAQRFWNVAFGAALVGYLAVGTTLLAKSMNADGGRAVLLIAAAMALLFLAAFTCPGWWAVSLPFVTLLPVAVWGHAECEPGYLDFCGLVWIAVTFVAVVVGLPVALVGTWLGHRARLRLTPSAPAQPGSRPGE